MPTWLAVNAGDQKIDIIWSVIGAAVLVFVLSLFRRRRRTVER
jgi:LPXTG-motif cell wall-anchored protein